MTSPSIAIINYPRSGLSNHEQILSFYDIIDSFADQVFLVGSSSIPLENNDLIGIGAGNYTKSPILNYLLVQVIICKFIISHRDKLDMIYFHKGTKAFLLPITVSKLCKLNHTIVKTGAFHKQRKHIDGRLSISAIYYYFQLITFYVADSCVVFSESQAAEVPNSKVYIGLPDYRDFEKFDCIDRLEERKYDLGFVGRFHPVKGVDNILEASLELEANSHFDSLFVGDGPLNDKISNHNQGNINVKQWMDLEELPKVYNEIRCLIIASEAEAGPLTLIEAMGCGCVVISTEVGIVPDIIKDEENGFLLENNSPDHIVRTFNNVIGHDNINQISKNARDTAVEIYNKQSVNSNFQNITRNIIDT